MSTNSDLIAQFHAYLLTEKRVSENTFAAYSKDIEQLELYLTKNNIALRSMQKKHLSNFLKLFRDQGMKAKTLSRKISTLKLFFTYIHQHFKVPNIAKALVFPQLEKTLPTYLSEAEIQKLLTAANVDGSNKGVRNKVMLYLLYATGMRVTELVNVSIDQLHFDSGFIQLVGKGKKERMVPLPKNILELLRYYLDHVYPKVVSMQTKQAKDDAKTSGERPEKAVRSRTAPNYLFTASYNNTIKPISRQSFWMILKKVLVKAGITKNVSPHSLRHSLATHLLKNGADIRSLQLLLGHENISTVQVYTHLEKSQVRKVYDEKHPRA